MSDARPAPGFPVLRAGQLETEVPEQRWLICSLWGRAAVGIVGGAPKVCKSWLGIDMAVSVASETPCLGRLLVEDPGPTLIYLAEDSLPAVRSRIASICRSRSLDIDALDLHVITASSLRLDLDLDRRRLGATVERIRPRMILLDPLVRLHRLDENSSSDISGLLGFLRQLQRRFNTAVVLVHHASKKQHAHPGQALRGSSDLHAWSDSSAYLIRRKRDLLLVIEHRSSPEPKPFGLELISDADESRTHLQILSAESAPAHADESTPRHPNGILDRAVLDFLRRSDGPVPRTTLRDELHVNNNRLGDVLASLERRRLIQRSGRGWLLAADPPIAP